jgi:hypothetical protein
MSSGDRAPFPAAVRRALRDVASGHITLWARVERFDSDTGRRLAEPRVTARADRVPAGLDADWWRPLLASGVLAVREDVLRPHLYVTGICMI